MVARAADPRNTRSAGRMSAAFRARPAAPRLLLDPIRCTGHGMCAELFPERIELDDWGYPIVEQSEIPDELHDHARRAVKACPALALRLEEGKAR